ncbi:MAG TPA: Hsp20/alpha crystallin family protein [Planctomycetota bacterium]|nr:Hsp20/alpha crystallin family protein [Planctomycetota bacterium]
MIFPLSRFDPASEIRRLQDDFDSLFSGHSGAVHAFPPVNVWRNEDGVVVTAELPGVERENIDVSVVGDTLTLRGGGEKQSLKEGDMWHRRERLSDAFTRTLQLPFHVDATKVEASFDKGVLTIRLPRAEQDKPRKITIKAA